MDRSPNNLPRGSKAAVAKNKESGSAAIDDDNTKDDSSEDGSPNSKRSKEESDASSSEDESQNDTSSKLPSYAGGSPLSSSVQTGDEAEDYGSVYFVSPHSEGAMARSKKVSHPITISSEANAEGIYFTITTNGRFKTNLGGKHQGDHVTAYATFIELIYNATHERSLDEIIDLMQKLIDAVIRDEDKTAFEESQKKFSTDSKGIISRDERKIMTARLRKDVASPEQITKLKNSCKLAENALVGQFIASTATTFIAKLNGLEGMAYEADEELDKEEKARKRGAQGSVIKKAIYCISLINLVQKMKVDDPEEVLELIDDFEKKSSTSKQGLKEIIKFFNQKGDEAKEDETKLTDSKIKEIKEELKSPKSLIENNNKVAELVGKKVADLFDFRYERGRQMDTLFKHMARHLAIVFNTFEGLQPYLKNPETCAIFLSHFVREAALDKAWDKYRKIDNVLLNQDDITEGIKKNFNFDTCKVNSPVGLNNALLIQLNQVHQLNKGDTSQAAAQPDVLRH